MCSLLSFSDMSKQSLVSSFVVVVVGLGEGRGGRYLFIYFIYLFIYFYLFIFFVGWKICNVNVL